MGKAGEYEKNLFSVAIDKWSSFDYSNFKTVIHNKWITNIQYKAYI